MTTAPGGRHGVPDAIRQPPLFFAVPPSRGDREEVSGIFAYVAATDTYARPLCHGDLTVYDWYEQERLRWAYVLYQQGRAVGHIGAQYTRTTPGGLVLPSSRTWEMCRMGVAQDCRRYAVAGVLVELAEATFGNALWVLCQRGSDTHLLLQSRGWVEAGANADPADTEAAALIYPA